MTTARKEQTEQEYDIVETVLDHLDVIHAARDAGVTGEELHKLVIAMPLFPKAAKGMVMRMGKKWFLEKGYDRTLADAEYGAQWIDEVDDERFSLTGMRD